MAVLQTLTFAGFETTVNSDTKIEKCWNPGVTKFTPGSFYNFEQDNEPLYDLEERSYFNWQKMGFPSQVPGSLHLLVSADAPEESITCNSNIFRTLQEAIDSLPKFINCPTRISVASFGDLGKASMEGITVDPIGNKLEIVNINTYDKAGVFSLVNPVPGVVDPNITVVRNQTQQDAWINSFTSDGLIKTFNSSGIPNSANNGQAFGGVASFLLKQPVGVYGFGPIVSDFAGVENVFSSTQGTLDERAVSNYTAFITPIAGIGTYDGNAAQIGRLSVGEVTFTNPTIQNQGIHVNCATVLGTLDLYEEVDTLGDINDYDPSSYNQQTTSLTYLKRTEQQNTPPETQRSAIKTVLYGNYLQGLKISNCQGKIYFINFYCKGAGQVTPGLTDIGIQIDDCNDINLRSVACSRFATNGIQLTNSKVTFSRSLYIHRCYEKTISNPAGAANQRSVSSFEIYEGTPNTRLSKPWVENIKSLDAPDYDRSAGIVAFNSEIVFSRFETQYLNSLLQNFGTDMDGPLYRPGVDNCQIISRCSTGIRLVNSVMRGGQGTFVGKYSTTSSLSFMDYLNIEGNANYGIDAINSQINLDSCLEVFQNTRGLRAKNSEISLDRFKFDNNHKYGIKLDDSKLVYGHLQLSATPGARLDYENNLIYETNHAKRYQFVFDSNGHHILAKNSVIQPGPYLDPLPNSIGRMVMNNAHAAINDNGTKHPLPSNILDNTEAKFVHLASLRLGETNETLLGAHVYLGNNSEVTFLGSASALTCLTSPQNIAVGSASKYVGVAAENGSTVKFRGPTAIYDGAVNVLANNNSNIIFEPHKKTNGTLDVEGFALATPTNHTMVELKAIRSCLVANNNSNIVLEDLGSYSENWGAANTYYPELNPLYTSSGFFQFYPNPNDQTLYGASPYSDALNKRGSTARMVPVAGKYYWGFNYVSPPGGLGPYEFSGVTNGGVCVKATNNSNVRVRNVNFPCGWWNASGVIYDTNDPLGFCGKLFIWNLSNNSTLVADHLSVSSTYPSNVGYFGPSAVWTSATNHIAYGAPSSTPDTSTLSVLDFFGYGRENAWNLPNGVNVMYGFDTPQNQGPFRLYVGVDSLATQLYQDGKPGYIPQLFAQGYNASGSLSAVLETSAVYGKLLRVSKEEGLQASGFYYNNEFVKVDPNAIMLDESAANTFANAKNGAMGTSNRAQICTIFNANTGITGEGKQSSIDALGSGFRSPNLFDILEEN